MQDDDEAEPWAQEFALLLSAASLIRPLQLACGGKTAQLLGGEHIALSGGASLEWGAPLPPHRFNHPISTTCSLSTCYPVLLLCISRSTAQFITAAPAHAGHESQANGVFVRCLCSEEHPSEDGPIFCLVSSRFRAGRGRGAGVGAGGGRGGGLGPKP